MTMALQGFDRRSFLRIAGALPVGLMMNRSSLANTVPNPINPTPADEECNGGSAGYLQPTAWNRCFSPAPPFGSEGRLPQVLRQYVQQGASALLQQAVLQAYVIQLVGQGKMGSIPTVAKATGLIPLEDAVKGRIPNATPFVLNPFLGLVLSGGGAFTTFQSWNANQSQANLQIGLLTQFLMTVASISSSAAQPIAQQTWNAVTAAASSLYGPIVTPTSRQSLGWIPVSAEDDSPTRPINVPTMPYPQSSLNLIVNGIPVRTRYMVASTLPVTTADIPSTGEVIVFIHGHMSKIEEASDFAPQLLAQAQAANRPLTLVMFDQPSCGYSSMVDHSLLDPGVLNAPDGQSPGTSGSAYNAAVLKAVHNLSAIKFIQAHITALIDALDQRYQIATRISAFVGGSLGGHMGVRFACEAGTWPTSVVAWSPASMWSKDSIGPITIAGAILDGALANLVTETTSPTDPVRANYFSNVFDQPTHPANSTAVFWGAVLTFGVSLTQNLGEIPAQPLMWYRAMDSNSPHAVPAQADDWACKAAYIANSRVERQEIYNRLFRDWHWRVAAEMCYFNFLDDPPVDNPQPYYNRVARPLLLMSGVDDDYPWVSIHDYCQNFVKASSSPLLQGEFVNTTGHSIHNERPSFLASTVLAFAAPPQGSQSKGSNGATTCTPPKIRNAVGECVEPTTPTCSGTIVDGKCIPKGAHPQ
jgi:pimeloyl-ACP methyl ester carboxylesterase